MDDRNAETDQKPGGRRTKTSPQTVPEPSAPDSTETELPENREQYPLRPPGEDPRWAVRTVKAWIGFALLFLVFILTMLFLGVFYD